MIKPTSLEPPGCRFTAAVIGMGFGREHERVYAGLPEIELVAAADQSPARREDFAGRNPGACTHDTLEGLLAGAVPDILSICTPHHLHASQVIAAAKAGVRAIYVEKPMAMNLGEADRMIEACQRSGTLLVVGHQRRLGPAAQAVRMLLESGRLGPVTMIHTRWGCGKLEWNYEWSGGGALMYLGVHSLDLFRYLVGEIAWVQGRIQRDHPEHSVESYTMAMLRSVSGIPIMLETGEGISGHATHILLARGQVQLADHRVTCREGDDAWQELPLGLPADLPADRAWLYPVQALVLGIMRSLREQVPHPAGMVEGRAALELAMAIYESHRIAAPVALPFQGSRSPLERMLQEGRL